MENVCSTRIVPVETPSDVVTFLRHFLEHLYEVHRMECKEVEADRVLVIDRAGKFDKLAAITDNDSFAHIMLITTEQRAVGHVDEHEYTLTVALATIRWVDRGEQGELLNQLEQPLGLDDRCLIVGLPNVVVDDRRGEWTLWVELHLHAVHRNLLVGELDFGFLGDLSLFDSTAWYGAKGHTLGIPHMSIGSHDVFIQHGNGMERGAAGIRTHAVDEALDIVDMYHCILVV